MARPSYEVICEDCGVHNVIPRLDGERSETTFVACRCGRESEERIRKVSKPPKGLRRGRGKKRTALAKRLISEWWEGVGEVCANCDAKKDWAKAVRIEGHHVVRQALIEEKAREEGWSQERLDRVLWDPRNRLDVCTSCHEDQHKRGKRLPWRLVLRAAPKAPEFAREIGLLLRAGREYRGGPE